MDSPALLVTLTGFLGSLAAGLMTSVGALAVFYGRIPSRAARDALLGFAAGVMLAASFFSLIVPALEEAETRHAADWAPPLIVVVAILLGAAAVAGLNRAIPHQHFESGRDNGSALALRRIWLFTFAIAIHNFPEGLAVGVGFASGSVEDGLPLAIGIGLQNVPEGLAVAVALMGEGYSRRDAFGIATCTGLVEPVGGAIGAGIVSISEPLLPWGLAFAAGAMLFVISHEIIPETHRCGHRRWATTGLMIGLVAMLYLDVSLAA